MYYLSVITAVAVILVAGAIDPPGVHRVNNGPPPARFRMLQCFFGSSTFSISYYSRAHRTSTELTTENLHILDNRLPTKVIFHGYCSNARRLWISQMLDAYLEDQDYNIIVVDWSRYSSGNYFRIIRSERLREAADKVAVVLHEAIQADRIGLSSMHFVGHSLGAHLGGILAQMLHSIHGKKIGRLTCLDAAGIHINSTTIFQTINPSAIDFIDAMHTSSLGPTASMGHADFYLNGGRTQPGCAGIKKAVCSHKRILRIWVESIYSEGFVGRRCPSLSAFERGDCDDEETAVMGEHVPVGVSGTYYLRTNERHPYARGLEGSVSIFKRRFTYYLQLCFTSGSFTSADHWM